MLLQREGEATGRDWFSPMMMLRVVFCHYSVLAGSDTIDHRLLSV